MKYAHENGLKNVWVSNGYMSSACLRDIMPYLDAINVDLKSMDPDFYQDNCSAKLRPVLDNLITLKQNNIHLEITTLVIPTLSDDIAMLSDLADFISSELDNDTPWHITKFSPNLSWRLKHLDQTGEDRIYEAYQIGKDAGLRYVYVGNIPGDQKENTYCPKCGELGIRRLGANIERFDQEGRCTYCDRDLDIIEQ
jgi:pyruvate formate lyase activating enzyme